MRINVNSTAWVDGKKYETGTHEVPPKVFYALTVKNAAHEAVKVMMAQGGGVRGGKPTTKAEKGAAWREYHELPEYDRPPLEQWLDTKYGVNAGQLEVPVRTFQGWKRYAKNSP